MVRVLAARRAFRRRRASTACEIRRDPRSRSSSPRLRAAQLLSGRVMLLGLPSLCSVHAEGRGLEPPSAQRNRAATSGPVGRARAGRHADPAVKTGNPRLPPRGAGYCAVGGIRAWAGNPGRRPASCRHYSYRAPLCKPDLNSLLDSSRGGRDRVNAASRQRHGAPPQTRWRATISR